MSIERSIVERLREHRMQESSDVYKVSHQNNGVYQGIMFKADSEEEAEEKYKKKYPRGKFLGAQKMNFHEVESMRKRGMSIVEEEDPSEDDIEEDPED